MDRRRIDRIVLFVNLISLLILSDLSSALRQCYLDEFHYEYTECDSSGGRWRVSVPKVPGVCTPGSSPGKPLRGKNCTFACTAGEFLDVQGDQECHSCPAGTYSLGGGIRFHDWDEMPSGFVVKTQKLTRNSWLRRMGEAENCSRVEWTPRGKYLMSIPGQCPTSIFFSAKLVRAGKVIFEYQYTDPEAIFHFTVQNDQCQAIGGGGNDKWPKITSEGKWGTMVVSLKSGMNVLQWKAIGSLSRVSGGSSNPILIRKIDIIGVAYTSSCTKCPNGTLSSGGASFCEDCQANTYSEHGSSQCVPCKGNEYSEPGASSCQQKPSCTEKDYFAVQKPCNSEGKTQKTYKWRQPQICDDQGKDSATLPNDGLLNDCPKCDDGMYQVNVSHCDFCPPNQYVDYTSTCQECPSSTAPDYGLSFKSWVSLPPNVTSHCITLGGGVNSCSKSAGWMPEGDHLKTNFGPQDLGVFLVLLLKTSGFRGEPGIVDGKPIPLAEISFEVEINCETPCQLLLLYEEAGRNRVLQTWEESMEKTTFTNEIFTNESLTLTWAFQPDNFGYPEVGDKEPRMENYVKIYSIKLTNTLSGGATKCNSCPEGKTDDGCIPCPDGHYMDSMTQSCQACPAGTVLPSTNAWGKEACRPCGNGLHPVKGRSCRSDCKFVDDIGRKYDFTKLDGIHFVSGARLFTGSGTQYYHGFNMSLCNHKDEGLPTCVNNVTADTLHKTSHGEEDLASFQSFINQPGRVSAMVCRSTLVPQGDPDQPIISTQPVSLGSHLTKIVTNISLAEMYEEEGFPSENTERDIHFYYESGSATSACPKGRTSIVSLHCDPEATGNGKIALPPKCSDGTCDGCVFHFLWSTRLACAMCLKEDYKVVRGECVKGEQEIHYFPPDHCLQLPDSELKPNSQKCSVLPFIIIIAIPVAIGVGLILILMLVYCWSRNKRLEYKYMKLVETAGGHDGELPAAETCGMEDDEEDVHYSDERSTSFLSKIKDKFSGRGSRNQEDDNPFIAVKMSEKMTLT